MMAWTSSSILLVLSAVLLASSRTSPATTAKARPATPAREASMDALRARKRVCEAISSINRDMPVTSRILTRSCCSRLLVVSLCFSRLRIDVIDWALSARPSRVMAAT